MGSARVLRHLTALPPWTPAHRFVGALSGGSMASLLGASTDPPGLGVLRASHSRPAAILAPALTTGVHQVCKEPAQRAGLGVQQGMGGWLECTA